MRDRTSHGAPPRASIGIDYKRRAAAQLELKVTVTRTVTGVAAARFVALPVTTAGSLSGGHGQNLRAAGTEKFCTS
jgi:hypothetical protein